MTPSPPLADAHNQGITATRFKNAILI